MNSSGGDLRKHSYYSSVLKRYYTYLFSELTFRTVV